MKRPKKQRHEVPKNDLQSGDVNVKWFPPPPEGFDPLTADQRLLRAYGFPSRPDATTQPGLRSHWERAIKKIRYRVQPRLVVVRNRFHRHLPHPGFENPDFTTNWSGSVALAPEGEVCAWVAGEWTVPDCAPAPIPGVGDYYSAEWVGIDGYPNSGTPYQDLVQAGTESNFVGGNPSVYAWFEWVPDPQISLDGLPVAAGDLVYCVICVEVINEQTWALFFLLNETTGAYTAFSYQIPQFAKFLGNCAEWIVEAPSLGSILGGPTTVLPLAEFGAVYFDGAAAQTRTGSSLQGGDPSSTAIFLVDANNNEISRPTFENEHLVKVTCMLPGGTTH
jgi:hypothetical protein